MDYEKMLFEMAPWVKEVMLISKELNNGYFLRERSGWIKRGIKDVESIYEHSCKVGLASGYLFGTSEAVAQGVVHDFPEIFAEDYMPGEVDLNVKRKNEIETMKKLKDILPYGDYWLNTWLNFENKIGIGKQINELDKICPVIQAKNYLKENNGLNLEEFYPYARSKLETLSLIKSLDDLWHMEIPENKNAYEVYFEELKNIQINIY